MSQQTNQQQPHQQPFFSSNTHDNKTPTYWNYLKVNELLSLQNGVEDSEDKVSPDELNFIIVHQTLELWFKLILKELVLARNELAAAYVNEDRIPFVVHHINRVNEIFKIAKDHFAIMETLTTQDFLSFRGKLGTASGFQSFQLRQIESLMGLEEKDMVKLGDAVALAHLRKSATSLPGGAEAWKKIEDTLNEMNLKHALNQWLYRTPIDGSKPDSKDDKEHIKQFITNYIEAFRKLQFSQAERLVADGITTMANVTKRVNATIESLENFFFAEDEQNSEEQHKLIRIRAAIVFIESYRTLPLLSWPRLLIDKIVELEENFIIFRFRHARMVEREIGRRIGTGGSSGVDYLDLTTKYRVFTDLWMVRTAMLPALCLPELKNEEFYGFSVSKLQN